MKNKKDRIKNKEPKSLVEAVSTIPGIFLWSSTIARKYLDKRDEIYNDTKLCGALASLTGAGISVYEFAKGNTLGGIASLIPAATNIASAVYEGYKTAKREGLANSIYSGLDEIESLTEPLRNHTELDTFYNS